MTYDQRHNALQNPEEKKLPTVAGLPLRAVVDARLERMKPFCTECCSSEILLARMDDIHILYEAMGDVKSRKVLLQALTALAYNDFSNLNPAPYARNKHPRTPVMAGDVCFAIDCNAGFIFEDEESRASYRIAFSGMDSTPLDLFRADLHERCDVIFIALQTAEDIKTCLSGAFRTITFYEPRLIIPLPNDINVLIEVSLFFIEKHPQYRLFLGYHGVGGAAFVLYATVEEESGYFPLPVSMETEDKCGFSVIISADNNTPQALRDSLDSVLLSHFPDVEIFIIDNAANGETGRIVAEYLRRYPKIVHTFRSPHTLEDNAAFLSGLKFAGGTYVAFIKAGDILAGNTLREALSVAKKECADILFFENDERAVSEYVNALMLLLKKGVHGTGLRGKLFKRSHIRKFRGDLFLSRQRDAVLFVPSLTFHATSVVFFPGSGFLLNSNLDHTNECNSNVERNCLVDLFLITQCVTAEHILNVSSKGKKEKKAVIADSDVLANALSCVMLSIVVYVSGHNVKDVNQCMDSIISQQCGINFEVIIVDDASPADVAAFCAFWGEKDSRIRVCRHESAIGPGRSKNEGISLAKGKYITFVDGDAYLLPRVFIIGLSILETHPDIDILAMGNREEGVYINSENLETSEGSLQSGDKTLELYVRSGFVQYSIGGHIFKNSIVKELTFRPSYFFSDISFLLHAYSRAKLFLWVNYAAYIHKMQPYLLGPGSTDAMITGYISDWLVSFDSIEKFFLLQPWSDSLRKFREKGEKIFFERNFAMLCSYLLALARKGICPFSSEDLRIISKNKHIVAFFFEVFCSGKTDRNSNALRVKAEEDILSKTQEEECRAFLNCIVSGDESHPCIVVTKQGSVVGNRSNPVCTAASWDYFLPCVFKLSQRNKTSTLGAELVQGVSSSTNALRAFMVAGLRLLNQCEIVSDFSNEENVS